MPCCWVSQSWGQRGSSGLYDPVFIVDPCPFNFSFCALRFPEHHVRILETAKLLVDDTKKLVSSTGGTQEALAEAATNAVKTITSEADQVEVRQVGGCRTWLSCVARSLAIRIAFHLPSYTLVVVSIEIMCLE